MTQLAWAVRFGGLGVLARLGSQQVARSNAASAAAVLMRRREEREDVDAYLARRLPLHPRAGSRAGTAS